MESKSLKIALLTPYTGGNLGDAAIQDAVIENIRKRYPDAVICMITLRPDLTTKLHGVPSFPITPFAISYYASDLTVAKVTDNVKTPPTSNSHSLLNRIKNKIKTIPWFHSFLKSLQQIITRLWSGPNRIYQELFHLARAYKLMKKVDILIVSGGGQLDDYWGGPWGHPYALFRWGLLAKATGSKYIFLSVGTCALESKLSIFFIRHALNLANYRSYRDKTSKQLLEDISFTRNDLVYPDLAFSYTGRTKLQYRGSKDDGKVVGVSPIAYLSQHGWPKRNIQVYENYFNTLVAFISTIIRRGYSVVILSTDGSDRKVVSDIVDSLKNKNEFDITDKISHPQIQTVEELLNQLNNVDYVVASRLHGVLLSNLCCLPVLAISYDRKVDTYMADAGFPEYSMDIHNIEINSLLKNFESLTTNSGFIQSRLMDNNNSYAYDLKCQYNIIFEGEVGA
jgi:polysaccharide pyruvyl transferase WcaK-like protein